MQPKGPHINVYSTEESVKEKNLADEGAAQMMHASGILGNLDRIRDVEEEFFIDSERRRTIWEEEMNDEVTEEEQENVMMTSQNCKILKKFLEAEASTMPTEK